MKMLTKTMLGVMFAALVFTGAAFAKTHNINVMYNATIDGHLILKPGTYRLAVNNSALDSSASKTEATFYKNGKLVGKVPVKLVAEARKNNQSEVFYNAPAGHVRPITEIKPSGWKDKLVFNKS